MNLYGTLFIVSSLLLSGMSSTGWASTDLEHTALYYHNLQVANHYVETHSTPKNDSTGAASADSVSFQRTAFAVGQSWDVLAFEPVGLQKVHGRVGVFHYEVIDAQLAPLSQVTLKITQLEKFGIVKVDSNVSDLTVTLNQDLRPVSKTYHFMDQTSTRVKLRDGLHAHVSALEGFPLLPPEFSELRAQAQGPNVEIPNDLFPTLQQNGISFALSNGTWMEGDDFFGRQVQTYWTPTSNWPVYLKNSQGISIRL